MTANLASVSDFACPRTTDHRVVLCVPHSHSHEPTTASSDYTLEPWRFFYGGGNASLLSVCHHLADLDFEEEVLVGVAGQLAPRPCGGPQA